jgi:hypothetical protein
LLFFLQCEVKRLAHRVDPGIEIPHRSDHKRPRRRAAEERDELATRARNHPQCRWSVDGFRVRHRDSQPESGSCAARHDRPVQAVLITRVVCDDPGIDAQAPADPWHWSILRTAETGNDGTSRNGRSPNIR